MNIILKLRQKLFGPTRLQPSENPYTEDGKLYCNYFATTPNWGDSINLYLLSKLSKKEVVACGPEKRQHVLAVGSILRMANHNSIVWGSGFISKKGNIKYKPLKVCAVRGPLTRELLLNHKIETPEIYGDPALLMPRFYFPKVDKKYALGIVPHYRDKNSLLVKELEANGVKVLDIGKDDEAFIDELLECEHIISSSLHGLIASDAYGIPSHWITLSDKLTGGGFKFHDYYSSIKHPIYKPTPESKLSAMSLDDIIRLCTLKKVDLDLDALVSAFPFKS